MGLVSMLKHPFRHKQFQYYFLVIVTAQGSSEIKTVKGKLRESVDPSAFVFSRDSGVQWSCTSSGMLRINSWPCNL
jgi:hypothetical protein